MFSFKYLELIVCIDEQILIFKKKKKPNTLTLTRFRTSSFILKLTISRAKKKKKVPEVPEFVN